MKILVWSDAPNIETGYGKITKGILDVLATKHEVTVIGINYHGGWIDPEKYKYKVYPAIYNDYTDPLGIKRFSAVLMGVDHDIHDNFDAVLIQLPTWDFFEGKWEKFRLDQIVNMYIKNNPKNTIKKIIYYTPIESPTLTKDWTDALAVVDTLVVPTNWGKKVIERHDKKLGEKTKVIEYGIDTNNFYPVNSFEKKAIQNKMQNKFVVGFVGANQWRKDHFHLIKAFSAFHKIHPDSALYMHTFAPGATHWSYNCLELLKREGLSLGVDYIVPQNIVEGIGLKRNEMNIVYNMMDVQMSFSMGEGFCLPLIEAMLAGTINIFADNSVLPGLMNFNGSRYDMETQVKSQRGFIMKNIEQTSCWGNIGMNIEYSVASVEDAVTKLEWVYKNRKSPALQAMRNRAETWAKTLTADAMGKKFLELL